MHPTINLLISVSLILSLSEITFAASRPRPESIEVDGTCSPSMIAVSTATKLKQGLYLLSDTRANINPNEGKYSSVNSLNDS